MDSILEEILKINKEIATIEEDLAKGLAYIETLKTSLELLAYRKESLKENIKVLKEKGIVSLIDEYSKSIHLLASTETDIKSKNEELNKFQKAVDKSNDKLGDLKTKKAKIEKNIGKVILFRRK